MANLNRAERLQLYKDIAFDLAEARHQIRQTGPDDFARAIYVLIGAVVKFKDAAARYWARGGGW